MRLLRVFAHVTLDGVIQNSDDGDGFPHPDWGAPYRSSAGRDAILAAQGERFDLLLGRRTYDIWSGHWPKAPASPMAERMNAATKYIVTHRPDSLSWGPAESVKGELAPAVRAIKAAAGPDLVLWGSSTVTPVLFHHGLVDEVTLIMYPLTLGAGKHLFAAGTPPGTFTLVSHQAFESGLVRVTYAKVIPH